MSVTAPHELDLVAGVDGPVGVDGQVHDPEIYAEKIAGLLTWLFCGLVRDEEQPLAGTRQAEADLSFSSRQHALLGFAHTDGGLDPALQRPERDRSVRTETEEAGVIGLGGVLLEPAGLVLLSGLVRVGDLGNAADGRLGAEAEALARLAVDQSVEFELSEDTRLNGLLGNPSACFVAALKGGSEERNLVSAGKQSDLSCENHLDNMALDYDRSFKHEHR